MKYDHSEERASTCVSHLRSLAYQSSPDPPLWHLHVTDQTQWMFTRGMRVLGLASQREVWSFMVALSSRLFLFQSSDSFRGIGHDCSSGLPHTKNLIISSGNNPIIIYMNNGRRRSFSCPRRCENFLLPCIEPGAAKVIEYLPCCTSKRTSTALLAQQITL